MVVGVSDILPWVTEEAWVRWEEGVGGEAHIDISLS